MRNAQQELNLHVNALQSELESLTEEIERLIAGPAEADGERRMDWKTPGLPGHVIAALLEGVRDRGFAPRVDLRSGRMTLTLSPCSHADPLPASW